MSDPQMALSQEDVALLAQVIEEFEDCNETSVSYSDLMRFANMGLLECQQFHVMPAARAAIAKVTP